MTRQTATLTVVRSARTAGAITVVMVAAAVMVLVLGSVASADLGDTTRVSVNSNGNQANNGSFAASLSTNGRYIAFGSNATDLVPNDTNGSIDVFVRDTTNGNTTRVSVNSNDAQANADSYGPSISAAGRYIAFVSDAANLVSGDTNN